MPAKRVPLRDVLAGFRKLGLVAIDTETWANSVRLTAPELRKTYPHEDYRLARHRDVLVVRLLDGQPTLVHRDLWPDLLAVAVSGARWQMDWLPPKEARLLEVVDDEGVVRLDGKLALRLDASPKHLGKTLMARLLVLGALESSGDGGTARTLVSWWRWAGEQGVAPSPDEDAARARIEDLAERARLPWHRRHLRHRWGW